MEDASVFIRVYVCVAFQPNITDCLEYTVAKVFAKGIIPMIYINMYNINEKSLAIARILFCFVSFPVFLVFPLLLMRLVFGNLAIIHMMIKGIVLNRFGTIFLVVLTAAAAAVFRWTILCCCCCCCWCCSLSPVRYDTGFLQFFSGLCQGNLGLQSLLQYTSCLLTCHITFVHTNSTTTTTTTTSTSTMTALVIPFVQFCCCCCCGGGGGGCRCCRNKTRQECRKVYSWHDRTYRMWR